MKPVVYRMRNADGDLLYIGSSASYVGRLREYATDRRIVWFDEVTDIAVEHHDTLAAARESEATAILFEAPRYNLDFNVGRGVIPDRRPEPSPIRRELGRRIRTARESAGLARETVAARCGVTKGCVCHWEAGRTVPSLTSQQALTDVLGVDHDDLFGAPVAASRMAAAPKLSAPGVPTPSAPPADPDGDIAPPFGIPRPAVPS